MLHLCRFPRSNLLQRSDLHSLFQPTCHPFTRWLTLETLLHPACMGNTHITASHPRSLQPEAPCEEPATAAPRRTACARAQHTTRLEMKDPPPAPPFPRLHRTKAQDLGVAKRERAARRSHKGQ